MIGMNRAGRKSATFKFRQLEHVKSDAQDHDAADGVEFAYDVRRHEGHDESRQQ